MSFLKVEIATQKFLVDGNGMIYNAETKSQTTNSSILQSSDQKSYAMTITLPHHLHCICEYFFLSAHA